MDTPLRSPGRGQVLRAGINLTPHRCGSGPGPRVVPPWSALSRDPGRELARGRPRAIAGDGRPRPPGAGTAAAGRGGPTRLLLERPHLHPPVPAARRVRRVGRLPLAATR